MRRSLSTAAAGVLAAAVTIGSVALGAGTAYADDGQAGVASPVRPTPTPTERAAAEVRPAIVRIQGTVSGYVVDENGLVLHGGQPLGGPFSCTGFGVDPDGYVATAGHCVDTVTAGGFATDLIGAAAAELAAADPTKSAEERFAFGMTHWKVRGATEGSPVDLQISVVTGSTEAGPTPQVRPAELVGFHPFDQGDVALVKIDVKNLPTVRLAPDTDVRVGTPLLSIGFPASADGVVDRTLEPSNKDGEVSSRKTVGGVPFYEISAALSPGMSGGPTVDMEGRVLGLNSWGPTAEKQAINFIAPSSGLAALMKEKGIAGRPGPNDVLFRSAIDDYYAGHYSATMDELDKLLAADSTHPQAAQLRAEAEQAKQQYGDAPLEQPPAPSGLPFGLAPLVFYSAVGGAAALLLGVIALVVAARRRRRRRRVPVVVPVPVTPPWGFTAQAIPQQQHQPFLPQWPTSTLASPIAVLTRPGAACPRCGGALHDEMSAFCHTCGLARPR